MAVNDPFSTKYYVKGGDLNKITYPSPFFDLSKPFMPKSIKTLFKYCRTFFYRNGFLNSVITKLTEYPITDILFEKGTDIKAKKVYSKFFYEKLKIRSLLVQIGLDYFTFGNSFISSNIKFKRYLKCPKCNESHQFSSIKFKWRNYEFQGECPKCLNAVTFKIKDVYLKNPDYFKFVRWSPENIDIEYDPLTGDSTYYYNPPASVKTKIKTGNLKTLETIPELFIKSLKEQKKIQLDPDNLYHFKRHTLAEEDMGFGKPIILSALADIWYLQTLRRGNEAIASEHIVPFRTLFPAPNGAMDPFSQMNLRNWRSKLENDVRQWKQDQNHIAIFPIPIGTQNIGGDAKMLLVTAELKFLEESIINSLGVPIEFIKGGASWTGSSISLRIVENHFINYRSLLEDFLNNFVILKANSLLKYPKTKVKFQRLRMADDTETKRLVLELASQNKISLIKLLEEFGINFEEEKDNIKVSKEFETELAIQHALKDAKAQGSALEIQSKAQVRAQNAALDEQARMREKKFETELAKEHSEDSETIDVSATIDKFAEEMMLMNPDAQVSMLKELEKKVPYTAGMISKRLEEKLVAQGMVGLEEPNPEQVTAPTPKKEGTTAKKPVRKDEGEKKKAGHPKSGPN